jgi:hypothetical protein
MMIVDWLNCFFIGFAIGFFWNPIIDIVKKVVREARIAAKEWNRSK